MPQGTKKDRMNVQEEEYEEQKRDHKNYQSWSR